MYISQKAQIIPKKISVPFLKKKPNDEVGQLIHGHDSLTLCESGSGLALV